MGARGPIPKRSEHVRGHKTKAQLAEIESPSPPSASSMSPVVQPPADDSWHPIALDWYQSLAGSGQAVFYQPSDWQSARVWAELLSRQLESGKPSAVMIAAWSAGATELLTTEGARRRARVELQRQATDADEEASVHALDDYRAELGA